MIREGWALVRRGIGVHGERRKAHARAEGGEHGRAGEQRRPPARDENRGDQRDHASYR